ncbi:alpha/beta hydrolase [Streptomyces sp. 8L]|uniref:alpha/beta hydrolase n=1 Tax=Streptomyces sp. 8L TaxID=2877242 RepID=UPI001CD2E3F9|nr:alpha/beta hydrolase [Streptomyces sp. 8L]MCA1219085.1 alpha/beta hydrolase [Streptomyces sp. 8L]
MSDTPAGPPVPSESDTPVGPPVPFDPELAAFLELLPPEAVGGGFTREDIPRRRAGLGLAEGMNTSDEELRAAGFDVTHRAAAGPAGAPDVPLLIVRPGGLEGPLPVVYLIHGGGMVLGDYRQGLGRFAEEWGRGLGCAIVSVDYRLAPEHPHPAPVEDCYAGLVWTAEHGRGLGLNTDRIVLSGGSAGGGLAAAVALLCRDREGPRLIGQMLICPMLDDRNDTPSARQMKGLGIWDQAANQVGWTALLGDRAGGPDVSPYAAPARATDLSGLPPAFIDVGSAETFRDEDVAYASRIWQAGGVAELHVWPGGFHGFSAMAPAVLSQEAAQAPTRWLRRLLAL